jgi:hypothetical protein
MSSVYASTTAGTVGFTVAQPSSGYTIVSTGLSPITTTDGYALYRFHSSGTISLAGINKYGPATIQIMCVGGGTYGGGFITDSSGTRFHIGGGAGGFVESTITLPTDQTINIVIGNGGTGSSSAQAPPNGENSTVSFTINTENNLIAYGGSGNGYSGNPTSNRPGYYTDGVSLICGGGGGSGGVGSNAVQNGTATNGGQGGSGKKPTKPGILTQYPTTYWAGGGGGGSSRSGGLVWPFGGTGGIGGGGGGRGTETGTYGSNAYATSSNQRWGGPNTGSGGGSMTFSDNTGQGDTAMSGGSGIVMIAIKI